MREKPYYREMLAYLDSLGYSGLLTKKTVANEILKVHLHTLDNIIEENKIVLQCGKVPIGAVARIMLG